jgi:hypothetical protein
MQEIGTIAPSKHDAERQCTREGFSDRFRPCFQEFSIDPYSTLSGPPFRVATIRKT